MKLTDQTRQMVADILSISVFFSLLLKLTWQFLKCSNLNVYVLKVPFFFNESCV